MSLTAWRGNDSSNSVKVSLRFYGTKTGWKFLNRSSINLTPWGKKDFCESVALSNVFFLVPYFFHDCSQYFTILFHFFLNGSKSYFSLTLLIEQLFFCFFRCCSLYSQKLQLFIYFQSFSFPVEKSPSFYSFLKKLTTHCKIISSTKPFPVNLFFLLLFFCLCSLVSVHLETCDSLCAVIAFLDSI